MRVMACFIRNTWGLVCPKYSRNEGKSAAKRDLLRLKCNWVLLFFANVARTINYTSVLPTNHQFIINPTAESLNITKENIEPGLEQSETFYSLTYLVLYAGHTTAAISFGLLFNFIPTWHLFVASTMSFIAGYLIYALATNGWMMLVARGLAGAQQGAVFSLVYAYDAVSFEKYRENLIALGKYDEQIAEKRKVYLYSSNTLGNLVGYFMGVGFPVALAQFPDNPQFRPAGWFCVAVGVALLVLQLLLFHGECTWTCHHSFMDKSLRRERKENPHQYYQYCQVLVPLFLILLGGLKGTRYVVPEVLLNPILSDSFGFSERETTYVTFLLFFTLPVGAILLFVLQCCKVRGYGLTLYGLTFSTASLLLMTDWQAMGRDPCTDYSLFHHPQLADQYRVELAESNISESGMVSVQSLQVVEGEVYQMAVNRCESVGEHCHWIPNSLVTSKHCSDCQPICKSTQHTLNFIQFTIGIALLHATFGVMTPSTFLLLSESVPQNYQGVSVGATEALLGISRRAISLLLDEIYEREGKRTYLCMLIQAAIFSLLLIRLLLLYPWLVGKWKISYSNHSQTPDEQDDEKTALMSIKYISEN